MGVTSPFGHLNVEDSIDDATLATPPSNVASSKAHRSRRDDDSQRGDSSDKRRRLDGQSASQTQC